MSGGLGRSSLFGRGQHVLDSAERLLFTVFSFGPDPEESTTRSLGHFLRQLIELLVCRGHFRIQPVVELPAEVLELSRVKAFEAGDDLLHLPLEAPTGISKYPLSDSVRLPL